MSRNIVQSLRYTCDVCGCTDGAAEEYEAAENTLAKRGWKLCSIAQDNTSNVHNLLVCAGCWAKMTGERRKLGTVEED